MYLTVYSKTGHKNFSYWMYTTYVTVSISQKQQLACYVFLFDSFFINPEKQRTQRFGKTTCVTHIFYHAGIEYIIVFRRLKKHCTVRIAEYVSIHGQHLTYNMCI